MSHPSDERYSPVEYEFTLLDGSKRYEIVMHRKDIYDFFKMHNAVSALPVQSGDR